MAIIYKELKFIFVKNIFIILLIKRSILKISINLSGIDLFCVKTPYQQSSFHLRKSGEIFLIQ